MKLYKCPSTYDLYVVVDREILKRQKQLLRQYGSVEKIPFPQFEKLVHRHINLAEKIRMDARKVADRDCIEIPRNFSPSIEISEWEADYFAADVPIHTRQNQRCIALVLSNSDDWRALTEIHGFLELMLEYDVEILQPDSTEAKIIDAFARAI